MNPNGIQIWWWIWDDGLLQCLLIRWKKIKKKVDTVVANFSIVSNPTWCSCCIPVASGFKVHLSDRKSNITAADLKRVFGLQRPAHYVNGNRSNLTWTWQINHRRYTPFVQHDLNLKMAPTFFSHQYNKAPTLSVRCAFSWRKIIKQNKRKKDSRNNQRSSSSWSWHHMISFKRWVKEHSRAADVILNIVRQSLGFESWKKGGYEQLGNHFVWFHWWALVLRNQLWY